MNSSELQQSIIADVNDILDARDLAHIQAFIRSLKQEVVADEEHWKSLPVTERERMIAAVHQPDVDSDRWITQEAVTNKYRKWFD